MEGKLLFLGTGSSVGVPVVTCKCDVCRSSNPHNHRLRPSVLIKAGNKQILIDAGPDFRMQALKNGIDHLDAILLTHTHFDHIAGIDDLRVFYFLKKQLLPCLLSKETMDELKLRYHYMFEGKERFIFQVLEKDFGTVEFADMRFSYLSYLQNGMKVNGFRLGNLAYVLDIYEYTDEVFAALKGVEILVLSALRRTTSPAHLSFQQAIDFAKKTEAKQIFFSHLSHDVDHEEENRLLPPNIRLAYDGQEISFGF